MKSVAYLSTILIFLLVSFAQAQTTYTNFDDFKSACANAQPGDEIILASGRYEAESITISDVQGTETNPVIIRAEEIGKDTLDNRAYFDLRHSSYIIIQGFVINISEKSTTFKIQTCNNIIISQNVLNGENEAAYTDDGDQNSSVWISIQSLYDDLEILSHDNKIDHNIFINKHTLGNMIRIDGTNELYVSQYDEITNNYFKNMGPRAENEMEAIRIGWSAMSESDGFCKVENNLFEECNGDPEIISVKCNKNTIAHNTFRRCQGTLSLRHGNESVVEGNFFLGEGAEGTGGVRIYGSDHRIVNNYFEGLTGTIWDAPITLTEGDADEGDSGLSSHFRIERAIIANNTLINNSHGIEIGYDNNGSYSKPPRDVLMAYNIIQADTNSVVKYINTPDNMTWINNICYTTNTAIIGDGLSFSESELAEVNPELAFNEELNYYKSSANTPTLSINTELVGEIANDIDGQVRNTPTNYGADEFSDLPILYKPLSPSDVGPSLGEYLYASVSNMSIPVAGGLFEVSITSNLNWALSTEADWLTLNPTSGSGYGTFTVTIAENTTGIVRNSSIALQSTNASGNELSLSISVSQADSEPIYIELSTDEITADATESESTFNISSNTSWTISTDSDWIQINPESGENNATISVSTLANESPSPRSGILTISDNAGISKQITVTQSGNIGSAVKLNVIEAIASTEQNEEGKENIAANVLDGDFDTRWSGEGDGAFITLELKDTCKVSFIKVGLYKGNERTSTFDIQTSEDGLTFTDALMNITSELTEDALVIYDFDDVTVKYVRIIGHGNSTSTWNSFTEFEIWGWELNPSAINDPLLNSKIFVYPNPSQGSFSISNTSISNLCIFNMAGRLVYEKPFVKANEIIQTGLKDGVYIVKLNAANVQHIEKIIIK
jgi:hypothetical protein